MAVVTTYEREQVGGKSTLRVSRSTFLERHPGIMPFIIGLQAGMIVTRLVFFF